MLELAKQPSEAAFEHHMLLAEHGDNLLRERFHFGIQQADGAIHSIHHESKNLLFNVEVSVALLQLLACRVLATNMARHFRWWKYRMDCMGRRSGHSWKQCPIITLCQCKHVIVCANANQGVFFM